MRVLVMGAGALGSVFGGLLARDGHEVCLVGREEHMRAIAEHGLHISGLFGDLDVGGIRAVTDPRACPSGPLEAILITVKSYDTTLAAEAVKELAGPKTLVVSLQNGLGNYEAIEAVFGPERSLAGRVIFGAQVPEAGAVEVTVYAEPVMLGSPADAVSYEAVERLAAAISSAGIPCEPTREITKFLWAKMLYNCALNPLSAILQVPYGGLLTHECSKAIMRRVVSEIFAVAAAEGVELMWKTPEDYIEVLFGRLIPNTAAHYASMLQDLRARKRTEIDALNGAIVRLGRAHGIETPMNEMLTCLIDARETWTR
jgi:2-dehydropantoate 2-reductase